MTRVLVALSLATLVALSGCHWFEKGPDATGGFVGGIPDRDPTAAQLVRYLNDNARRIQSVKCTDVDLDVKQGSESGSLTADLICRKPRDFFLRGKMFGSSAVQIGSNTEEFWFWVKDMQPAGVYHCSYDDLAQGKVRKMPFPIQPEWRVEAMGIAEYDETKNYRVLTHEKTYELEEQTTSPQGQPVRKVTVFNRQMTARGTPQINARLLTDMKGTVLAGAYVQETVADTGGTQAVLPRKLVLVWPAEKMEMKLRLNGCRINDASVDARAAQLFSSHILPELPSYDLARGVEAPVGRIRQAGGYK
jgi:hypothetical protein